ncbi:MAPEG family protein [Azospirillum sp.]|uniref:MAPEG family protein n=1 Tax=Azospirillum sp. TaxID=34012 RepID=UPI003D757398
MPLSSLSTALALVVYVALLFNVARARGIYGVKAPNVTGHPEFEKRYRVQMNTLEQLVFMLPALWLCAVWVGDGYAAVGGAVWSVGRIVYARSYYAAAEKRGPGFMLTFVPAVVMLVAALIAIVTSVN